MDASVAQFRRFMWKAGKECPHPAVEAETNWGRNTGNYVCTECGQTISRDAQKATDRLRPD
jgi:hypothetical protein